MESLSKTNSFPTITSVLITPEKPNKQSILNTIVQCQDPEGDPVTLHYQWIRNDGEMFAEKNNTLKSGSFGKGDLIMVKVVPSDGKTEGNPFVSSPVRIANLQPIVQQAWIEPKTACASDRLSIHAKAYDMDGDPVYYTYQWEKNGVVLPEEKSDFLEPGLSKKGDTIVGIVTPDDREVYGLLKKTEPITIANGPPMIVSSPPTKIEGEKYSYQVKASDPDEDLITYALTSHPKAMEIDRKTGLIRWEIKNGDKGNHEVEIEVSDPDGAKSFQKFTLSVDIR
jgi:hypothetical protein